MTVIITGAAGFLGSHLTAAYLARGESVIGVDNLVTGSMRNLAAVHANSRFTFVQHDVCDSWLPVLDVALAHHEHVTHVLNFASPASPPQYLRIPIETLRVGSVGTERALKVAKQLRARFIQARTSEVYGDPAIHPQPESYWGNVNPIGERSCYDESKRYAEAITMAYHRHERVDIGLVRIFNTFGPNLAPGDGRVVRNFIRAAIIGDPLLVYGDGGQTRSLCYVDDLVRGIVAMADSRLVGPINLGAPNEMTVKAIATLIVRLVGSSSVVVHRPLPPDDPSLRCPDITRARAELGWEPVVDVEDGLRRTIDWVRGALHDGGGRSAPPTMPGTEV